MVHQVRSFTSQRRMTWIDVMAGGIKFCKKEGVWGDDTKHDCLYQPKSFKSAFVVLVAVSSFDNSLIFENVEVQHKRDTIYD